jgi:hypothetical protein
MRPRVSRTNDTHETPIGYAAVIPAFQSVAGCLCLNASFAPKLVQWHPVLSTPSCFAASHRLVVGEQLRQRAAMGGEQERAVLVPVGRHGGHTLWGAPDGSLWFRELFV